MIDGADGLAAGADRVDEGPQREQRIVGLGAAELLVGLLLVGPVGEDARVEVDAALEAGQAGELLVELGGAIQLWMMFTNTPPGYSTTPE